jgi:hypothetical protein
MNETQKKICNANKFVFIPLAVNTVDPQNKMGHTLL